MIVSKIAMIMIKYIFNNRSFCHFAISANAGNLILVTYKTLQVEKWKL